MKKKVTIIISVIALIILVIGIIFFEYKVMNKKVESSVSENLDIIETIIEEEKITDAVCSFGNGLLLCDDKEIAIENREIQGTIVIEKGKITKGNITYNDKVLEVEDEKVVVVEPKEEEKNKIVVGDTSGASIPVLYTNNLIPVVYKGNSWVYADTEKQWYDYTKQEWANAVILKDGVTKRVGDIINVDVEVQGMYVWIPRFEYKIEGDYGREVNEFAVMQIYPGAIDINFIDTSKSAKSGYTIHPAFTFGGKELSGIWIGKFETSTTKTSECYKFKSGIKNGEYYGNHDSGVALCNSKQDPFVIPNVKSLRFQDAYNQFMTAKKFNNYVTDMDAHMSLNSEYTAALYLSESIYGKYSNSYYENYNKKISMNNNVSFITGCGANSIVELYSNDCNEYNTSLGESASTTGNITGVYDIAGGAGERVMAYLGGYYSTEWGSSKTGNLSGFKEEPESKYYDYFLFSGGAEEYNIRDEADANAYILGICERSNCKGMGLKETYRWYEGPYEYFFQYPTPSNPWFVRGLNSPFNLTANNGSAGVNTSFRIVLTDN